MISKRDKFWLIIGGLSIVFILWKVISNNQLESVLREKGEITEGISLGRSPVQFSGSSKVTVIDYWVNEEKSTLTTSKGMWPKRQKVIIMYNPDNPSEALMLNDSTEYNSD